MKKKFLYSLSLLLILFTIQLNISDLIPTSKISEQTLLYFHNFLETFIWLCFGYLINFLINNFLWQKVAVNELTRSAPKLLLQLSTFFVFLITISLILYNVYSYPVTTIWAASGALGLVIGLALKNLILDTFSGLAISLEKPFRVGDWISCHTRMGDYIGQVLETNWRATRLKTSSNNTVIIPNSFLTTTLLTNFSTPNTNSRFDQIITLDFSVPTTRAIKIIHAALQEAVLNNVFLSSPKPPKVKAFQVTSLGVEYKIKYFINPIKTSPAKARDFCLKYVLNHLYQAGISPSIPKEESLSSQNLWRQSDWEHQTDKTELLKRVSLFAMLETKDLEILASQMVIKHFCDGDIVVSQGEYGDSMFVVMEGILEVHVSKNNEELKVAHLPPGSFFGEKSLLTGEPRSATIKVYSSAVIGEISKLSMKKLLDSNSRVVNILSSVLASRDLNNQNLVNDLNYNAQEDKVLESKTNIFIERIRAFFS